MNKPPERPRNDLLRLQLMLAAASSLLILGWLSWDAYQDYRYAETRLTTISRMETVRAEIVHLDEVLTMSARMAAASGNPAWETRYLRFEPQLDRFIKEAMRLDPNASRGGAAAAKTDAANTSLVAMEHRAFELVRQGKHADAQRLLSSGDYEAYKMTYAAGMTEFNRHLLKASEAMRAELLADMRRSAITTIISAVLLILGALFTFRATRRWQAVIVESNRQLNRKTAELEELNNQLDTKVSQRTQDLVQANDQLRLEAEQRKEAERHLRIYAEVINSTGDAVIITDSDGNVVEINPAYQRATGRSREDVIGRNLHVPGRDPNPEGFYEELWRELKVDGYWAGEIMDRRNDGESFPCWALFNAVRDEQGRPVHYVCVMRDVTKLKQDERLLEKLAFHDSLTGLPNRALLKDRLNIALAGAARQNSMLGIICLDLDNFKDVNDTLGHAAGDRLLLEISQRIGRCLRSSDTLARMGGDEFTVLLPRIDAETDVAQVAERIIETLGEAVQLGDQTVYAGASIGISCFPKDGRTAETLQMNADLAMYEAKQAGRGQYRVFVADMLARGPQRLSLSVQIRTALENAEFTLAYQPMINLATGRPEGVEALIRWQKPGGEWVAPAMFIPHAERAGLIKKIDCWVLERACRDALTWPRTEGFDLPVSVNISAVSLQQPDMAGLIKDILQRTGLPPRRLNLEITESAVKADPNAAQAMLEEVTSLGVGFSVNDFGTGYSTLSYLSQFPINCLKLDRHFIERIGKDKASEEVIQMLVQLAHKLELRVVAEGVEQRSQQIFLTDAGCEIMQGYHFVRPMPGDQLAKWLSADHSFARLIQIAARQVQEKRLQI